MENNGRYEYEEDDYDVNQPRQYDGELIDYDADLSKEKGFFPHSKEYYRNWMACCIIGMINNMNYVVVNSSAQDLVCEFGVDGLIGLVLAANILAGVGARSLNTLLFPHVSAKGRVGANSLTMFCALALLSLCANPNSGFLYSYWYCLACIVILGGACSFGESAIIGHLRLYPPHMVSGWSSGTGWAGVIGAGAYLFFHAIGLSPWVIYAINIPTVFIYVFAFFWMLTPPPEGDPREAEAMEAGKNIQEEDDPLLKVNAFESDSLAGAAVGYNGIGEESGLAKYWRCTKITWFLSLNIFLVYFFEYVASYGAVDKAENDSPTSWWGRNSFTILAFCYQVGVVLSRSSLEFIKISRVEILTVLQAANFVLWLLQASYHFLPIWLQFILMIYVGVLGGASYVNIFYLLLNSRNISNLDRELCINIVAFAITLGIMASSLFTLMMDQTWLKDDASSGSSC